MRASVIAAVLLCAAGTRAHADHQFHVEPTRVELSARAPAGALVISNGGTTSMRLQASVFRWYDDPDGTSRLAPAPEIVVRPSIFEVAAGQSRTLRVGTTAAPEPLERSYRVFVEELPDRRAQPAAQIQVLMRIGVPVFIAPHRAEVKLITAARIAGPRAQLTVRNEGTRRAKLAKVSVAAMRDGRERWRREATGWYVLARRERTFAIDLGADRCEPARDSLSVVLTDEDGVATTTSTPCVK